MNATPSELTRKWRASGRRRSLFRVLGIGFGVIVGSVVTAVLVYTIEPALPWIGLGGLMLILGLLIHGCIVRWRTEREIGASIRVLNPGLEGEFRGILSLGFEVQSVTVATGNRRFLVWPVLEDWVVLFPAEFRSDSDLPLSRGRGSNDVARWFIRFVGTPSDMRRYSHAGACCREVRISRILEAHPVNQRLSRC